MISAKSEVVSRNGSASERIPAPARCMSRAITRRSVVSRDRRSTSRGDHHVAVDELLHQRGKLRPVGRGAGDFLAEHFFTSRRFELADLAALVLSGRGDASIAVNHALILPQKSASKKRNLFKAPI